MFWLLWLGCTRHPGPFGCVSLGVEPFDVGGWLTHGDSALRTVADFLDGWVSIVSFLPVLGVLLVSNLCVLQASQKKGSNVCHAGVGAVCLKGLGCSP